MRIDQSAWACLARMLTSLSLWSPDRDHSKQTILANGPESHVSGLPADVEFIALGGGADDGKVYALDDGTPVIPAPKNPQEGGDRLTCEYPAMAGWVNCHGPESRDCWLQNSANSQDRIDVDTDYEDPDKVPVGITRRFSLTIDEQPISPDGVTMEHGKVYNRTYPGPWLEACWGDWVEVAVTNNLRWNGTSVHWHGIRQFHTNQHDGVSGITECPIPPGETYVYKFRALQYGSAWYHSHYSLQYGDGLLGPLTIYGPSTANYASDDTFRPILMTDWNHRSGFEDWPLILEAGAVPEMTNILLNGTGQFGPGKLTESKYGLIFEAGKTHMLILVNTAIDTTFVFSIDNHMLQVIAMDFVPIEPYMTDHIKVGISQRYHVIVKGLDNPFGPERNGNYWMRTMPARECSKFAYGPDEQMGLVRYNPYFPKNLESISDPFLFDTQCGDEPYEKLVPRRKWTVGNPSNIDPSWTDPEKIPWNQKYVFDAYITMSGGPGGPYIPDDKPYMRWSMHQAPLRINMSDPTILNLDNTEEMMKEPHLDIVTLDEQEEDAWIWMVMTAPEVMVEGNRIFIPAAHPIHLHGHDFGLLRQSLDSWYDDPQQGKEGAYRQFTPDKMNCQNELVNCENPPRRDSILLPAGGYAILAFKADNPGSWILHCHIAFHASSGMAMQILENKHIVNDDIAGDREQMQKNCKKWQDWQGEPMNHWDFHHPSHFQDDSGV